MTYELNIEPKAERFLKKLKKKNSYATSVIASQILERKKDPFTPRSKCDIAKVGGHLNEFRLRIRKGRVEYNISDNEIKIKIY